MTNTILLVEDEEALSSYLIPELQFEDYQVLLAKDGVEALQLYDNNRGTLDLIILDWMLPRLDGLEVLRRIRKSDSIPIIIMTARGYIGDKVAGLDSGADDYITKPFEIEELLARIRVIFRHKNHRSQKANLYTVENLTLNTKARQVIRGNNLIQLTQREYELLLMLIQHAGETLTRNELLDSVWGVDFEGQTNVVDVYIRYLRNKIDRPYPKQLIHTVRGIGYVLSGNYQD